MKYTIKDFQAEFPNDDICLDYIFNQRFGKEFKCPKCDKIDSYYRIKKRKSYACAWCANQVYPTKGTIFEKSDTPLTSWFYVIFLMSQAKNGISAKEIERHLGVTYKTAWRMGKQIRMLMIQEPSMLGNTVEADETYVGGKGKNNKRGRGAENKTPVFGVVERKGQVKAKVVTNVKSSTIMPLLKESVVVGTTLMTDEFNIYNKVEQNGYIHKHIHHATKQYVIGDIYTNTIEGFWSQLKRSIDGTFHKVSPKYLQSYVDQFVFHYNFRSSSLHPFSLLMARISGELY